MSTDNSNYNSAIIWAKTYAQKTNNGRIDIFWIMLIFLFLALAAWWYWINCKPSFKTIKPRVNLM